jgi:hypothetical protein
MFLDSVRVMRRALLDLTGDHRWRTAPWSTGLIHVDLSNVSLLGPGAFDVSVIIDARGRHEEGIALLEQLRGVRHRELILLTDREAPDQHSAAYLAGATRICVLGAGEALGPELAGLDSV